MSLNESTAEDAALEWFGELGYSCLGAEAFATLRDPAVAGLPKLLSGELSVAATHKESLSVQSTSSGN